MSKPTYKVVVELLDGEIIEVESKVDIDSNYEMVVVNGVVIIPTNHDDDGIPRSTLYIPLERVKSASESYEGGNIPNDVQREVFDEKTGNGKPE